MIALLEKHNRELTQAIQLLQSLTVEQYTFVSAIFPKGGIGKHMRHALDYYLAFFGRVGDCVDYDVRARDARVEEDPHLMARQLQDIQALLLALPTTPHFADQRLGVKESEPEVASEDASTATSSVQRELLFLLSHTVHHYAIISALLRIQNIPVPEGYGVAPSTRHYWQSHAVRS